MTYIKFSDLKVYKESRNLSKISFEIYKNLSYENKKIIGDQFIRSIDSIGANIAEGYGRNGKLDKIKFYYYSRGSLLESIHWLELLYERNLINKETFDQITKNFESLGKLISGLINSTNKNLT